MQHTPAVQVIYSKNQICGCICFLLLCVCVFGSVVYYKIYVLPSRVTGQYPTTRRAGSPTERSVTVIAENKMQAKTFFLREEKIRDGINSGRQSCNFF